MPISYPVTFPSSIFPRRVRWTANSVVGVSESPITLEQQVYVHQGEAWGITLEWPPLTVDHAETLIACLNSLNGREGTMLLSPPDYRGARGTWVNATPLVKGSGQSGKALLVDGIALGLTGALGDWFQIGNHIHKLTQAFVMGGAGEVTLSFWPRLRASPADNAPLTLVNPAGLWRLTENQREWSAELARTYGLTAVFGEAL